MARWKCGGCDRSYRQGRDGNRPFTSLKPETRRNHDFMLRSRCVRISQTMNSFVCEPNVGCSRELSRGAWQDGARENEDRVGAQSSMVQQHRWDESEGMQGTGKLVAVQLSTRQRQGETDAPLSTFFSSVAITKQSLIRRCCKRVQHCARNTGSPHSRRPTFVWYKITISKISSRQLGCDSQALSI
jgi:hypothetical protein